MGEMPTITSGQRKGANRTIGHILADLRCSLPQALEAIKMQVSRGNLSSYVLSVAVERVENQRERNGLSIQEVVDFEKFKASLGRQS